MVLGLKHGDRTDLVPAMAGWMCHAGRDVLSDDPVLVPVPLHRFRMLKRKFNQAAELAKAIHRQTGSGLALTALQRIRYTQQLGVSGVDDRFAELNEAIQPNPKARSVLGGQNVALVDDVMTSGATLSACTEACFAMSAKQVSILVLAHATKDA
ncbi:ComF family protein [Cognatiyoonia sp.]|uniref:ComF family protein n=1 Tax=Cognatiyoonia sp. TaxID=2211652 RepID=UPI003F6A23FC